MDYACKVSVIIPVYNMAKYLDETIASWTGQTLKDIEIIFVDDGSTDDSLHMLEEKAKSDNRIRVCTLQAHKGIYVARLCGIEKANGQYILFADADDTVLPETCEELALAMDESQVDILQYNIAVLTPNGIPGQYTGLEYYLSPYDGLLYGNEVLILCFRDRKYSWSLAGKIFKTELCKNVLSVIVSTGLHDHYVQIAEDAILYFMLSYTAQSYKGLRGKKYYQYYRGRGGSGHNTCTMNYFKELCLQPHVYSMIKMFLESKSTLNIYEPIIRNIRKAFLTNTIRAWRNLAETDKAPGLDLLLHSWTTEEVIGKIAEEYFNDTFSLAKIFHNSESLKYDGRPVKTIAAYYHRIANGGVQRVLCQLCYIWQAMGYKIIVLTDKEPCKDDFELPLGTERIIIPDFDTVTPHTYNERAVVLQHLIRDYHIDAVVYLSWVNHLLFWDLLSIKTAGASCIIHCHSIFSVGMLWMSRYDAFLEHYTLADAVVALSQTDLDFWKYYNANVHVTNNPLSDDISKWESVHFAPSHKILWIGRLSHEKNPMDVLPIMQDVVKAVPDALLTIVGKSEDGAVEKQLQAQIAKLHLEAHIKLAGFHKDVRPWYLESQIFLMTSSLEGYPLTLQESKMAGIPCVMYELPYLTLCEGNRGIIPVPQRDTKAAAQAIIRLLQDNTLCARYGRDARAHIEELAQFDFIKKWQQIFESVELTHASIVSEAEKLMMETLIAYHPKSPTL